MIIYDIESLHLSTEEGYSWDDIEALGFGTCVTWNSKDDTYKFWNQDQKQELINYMTKQLCVSYNGHHFDEVVLNGNDWRKKNLWFAYDLKNEILKQVFNVASTEEAELYYSKKVVHGGYGLDAICSKTLGTGKNNNSILMPELIRNRNYQIVFEYNLQDVRLLKQLLFYIIDNYYLINGYGKKINVKISKRILDY